MSQVLREAYQLRLGFFVVQRFTKNSLVLNKQGSLSAEMSHQNDALSHHFRIWCPKCHIKVKQCHITFEKMSHQSETLSHHFDIFGYFWHPKGVFGGFRGRFPLTRSILSYKMRIWRSRNSVF